MKLTCAPELELECLPPTGNYDGNQQAFTFHQDVATTVPSNFVFKISTITSSPDRFQWKLAGDVEFQTERSITTTAGVPVCLTQPSHYLSGANDPIACNSGVSDLADGAAVAGAFNAAWVAYVGLDRDDPSHQEITRIRYTFGATVGRIITVTAPNDCACLVPVGPRITHTLHTLEVPNDCQCNR